MASRWNKTILGDDWFSTFSLFRLNPETFLDRRKLTRDAFCLDVLKDLYLDHVEMQSKIHSLLLLQEFSSQLITDQNLVEQVFESLINLFRILGKKSEKRLLKSHVLVAIVTILLTLNLDQDVSAFMMKIRIFLLEIIYDSSEDSMIISSACNCLEEIETFYPGILQAEIKNILLACQRDTSTAFQSYVLLLNACIQHISTNYKNETETADSENLLITSNIRISPIISNVLELFPLMSHTVQYRVLKNLIHAVQNTSELSPKTFKLYINNLALTSEVPLFHLALDLQEAFGTNLFSDQEEKQLLKQLLKLSTHPCLTSSHRLLFLEWLKCYLKYNKDKFSILSSSDLQMLLPTPFDGSLTQEKKAHILALCIPSNSDERPCGDFLNETASGLIKCSLLLGGTRAAPSLFRTLFTYFSARKSETVYDSIYKLLTRIMKTSLHLTPYALSFIDSLKAEYKDRNFHERALDHMVEHILSVPVKQVYSNLDCYLTILERAAQESTSTCKPRAILRQLQKIFNNTLPNFENSWCIGNSILCLCRSLMKHHDVQIFYYDLAEVLCLIIQQFKDIDVKDRAKIYYSMLTSLSKFKVQTIFTLHSSEKEGKSTLNSFVTGSESLQFASCIQKLTKPVLQMIRIEQKIIEDKDKREYDHPLPVIVDMYLEYIASNASFLQLPFILKHVSAVEETFSELFSIVIKTQSEPTCKEICDIEIPILTNCAVSSSQEKIVSLRLMPKEPHPLILHFKAEFTCKNGYSYYCHLQPVILNLDDLFVPLPFPDGYCDFASSWRGLVFEALWKEFTRRISWEKETKCCQSVFALKIKNEEFSNFVENKWQRFIVSRLSLSEYHIAIHLPPENHLLLKISIVNDEPFINIIVDDNSTLPWITLYLQNINESKDTDM